MVPALRHPARLSPGVRIPDPTGSRSTGMGRSVPVVRPLADQGAGEGSTFPATRDARHRPNQSETSASFGAENACRATGVTGGLASTSLLSSRKNWEHGTGQRVLPATDTVRSAWCREADVPLRPAPLPWNTTDWPVSPQGWRYRTPWPLDMADLPEDRLCLARLWRNGGPQLSSPGLRPFLAHQQSCGPAVLRVAPACK